MSVYDSMAATSAVVVLAGAGVAKMKYFTFEGHTFSPIYLAGLAEEIKYDYLKVKKDSTKDGSSGYDAWTNTIYLNFSGAVSIEQKAMIVHEATHAMFDFQGRTMDIATSESIAYIAQCMYARANSTSADPDERLCKLNKDGEPTIEDGVFKAGWEIAGKLLGGGSIDGSDVSKMRAAVSAHPYYASSYTRKTNYNGY